MASSGRIIRKERSDAPPGFFEAEAAGLDWLREAEGDGDADAEREGDGHGGVRIARVHAVGPGWIELARVEDSRPTRAAARDFGRALARTHGAGADAFGAPPRAWTGPCFIGRQPLEVRPESSWGRFFADQRIRPYLQLAVRRRHVAAEEARTVERACALVASGAFDDATPPARLHGDLWNGNVLWSPDGVTLIDPAAHGGHPETDLAMIALFGCPHLDDVFEGYEDAGTLADGWRSRIPLHQLHPLAVHAASHGRSYAAPLVAAAERTLAL